MHTDEHLRKTSRSPNCKISQVVSSTASAWTRSLSAVERRGERYGAGFEDAVADFKAPPPTAGTGSAGLGDLAQDAERARK